jgi:hypothetical protein
MEPEGSLPCSQGPATGPYLSQLNPIHTLQSYFPKTHPIYVCLPSGPPHQAFK